MSLYFSKFTRDCLSKTHKKCSVKEVSLHVLKILENSWWKLALEALNKQPIIKSTEANKVLPSNGFELQIGWEKE